MLVLKYHLFVLFLHKLWAHDLTNLKRYLLINSQQFTSNNNFYIQHFLVVINKKPVSRVAHKQSYPNAKYVCSIRLMLFVVL